MFQDNNSQLVSPWGTAAKVQFNNALLAQGTPGENAFVQNNSTMLPIVDLARNLNATVSYDNKMKKVTLQYNGHAVELKLRSDQATVDGKSVKLKDSFWVSPSNHGYISAGSIANLPGLSVDTSTQDTIIQTK
jgi:phospholipase C